MRFSRNHAQLTEPPVRGVMLYLFTNCKCYTSDSTAGSNPAFGLLFYFYLNISNSEKYMRAAKAGGLNGIKSANVM